MPPNSTVFMLRKVTNLSNQDKVTQDSEIHGTKVKRISESPITSKRWGWVRSVASTESSCNKRSARTDPKKRIKDSVELSVRSCCKYTVWRSCDWSWKLRKVLEPSTGQCLNKREDSLKVKESKLYWSLKKLLLQLSWLKETSPSWGCGIFWIVAELMLLQDLKRSWNRRSDLDNWKWRGERIIRRRRDFPCQTKDF